MLPVTDNLIHFLGRNDKLSPDKQFIIFKSIIENGLRMGKSTFCYASSQSVLHVQIVCFTDIPLNLCDEHTAVYGKFGIGFKKSFVKRVGGNPVRYLVNYMPHESGDDSLIECRGITYNSLSSIFGLFKMLADRRQEGLEFICDDKGNKLLNTEQIDEIINQVIATFGYDKETGDLGPARDNDQSTDQYYREREWRIVPVLGNKINGSIKELDGYTYVNFTRKDINMIVVPNSDIKRSAFHYFNSLQTSDDKRLKEFGDDLPSIIVYDELRNW